MAKETKTEIKKIRVKLVEALKLYTAYNKAKAITKEQFITGIKAVAKELEVLADFKEEEKVKKHEDEA